MTLSFHCEGPETIKCYLYYMGGMMRFFLKDIIHVFPHIFESNNKKSSKPNDKYFYDLVKEIELPDLKFESFRGYTANDDNNEFKLEEKQNSSIPQNIQQLINKLKSKEVSSSDLAYFEEELKCNYCDLEFIKEDMSGRKQSELLKFCITKLEGKEKVYD
eukprot:539217_1